jgi:5-methylcytosine-specific restriction endonuclease McrA
MNCLFCNKVIFLKPHATFKIQKFCNQNCRNNFWRKNNPERDKQIRKKYRSTQEYKLHSKEYNRIWHQENREHNYKRLLQWRRNHKAQTVQQVLLRRCRSKGLPGSHTLEEWEELKKKYNYLCADCGLKKPLTRDHIIPVTKPGSTNYISNIEPRCRPCNSRKFNHIIVKER